MDLTSLPATSELVKLLESCREDHELMLTECTDGAMIMDCFNCPFRRVLDDEEETIMRKEELPAVVSPEMSK